MNFFRSTMGCVFLYSFWNVMYNLLADSVNVHFFSVFNFNLAFLIAIITRIYIFLFETNFFNHELFSFEIDS